MTAKKAPAKKTAARKAAPSDIAAFKKQREQAKDQELLELPSGLYIDCDREGLMGTFLAGGFIPNSLMSVVQDHIERGQEMKPEEAAELAQDPNAVLELYDMVDRVVIHVAREPKVHPKPSGNQRRTSTKLYVDDLNDDDKMFIFQWATGGTKDLATFREQAGPNMAALFGGQGFGDTPKPAGRSRKR